MKLRQMFSYVADKLTGRDQRPTRMPGVNKDPNFIGPPKPIVPGANILFCQDHTGLQRKGAEIAKQLQKEGYDVTFNGVLNEKELINHLEKLRHDNAPPPDAVFLDVGGVGEKAALKVIRWFDKNHPNTPLPDINFMSLDNSMGITEAGRLRNSDSRVHAHFVDSGEVEWAHTYLTSGMPPGARYLPASKTLREVLNKRLGTKIPLKHDDSYHADEIRKMMEITTDRIVAAWQRGKVGPEEVIEKMRGYATGLASSFRDGLYMQAGNTGAGIEKDAQFYGSAGFPVKGPAAFSIEEVTDKYLRSYGGTEKPVLFLQSYDPAVVPLLASGALGGIVVASPYMASHLKLLCETHMVSGLFGAIPKNKSLTSEFNEEAKPDLPPHYEGNVAHIAGHTVHLGQPVLVGIDGNGISFTPPVGVKTPVFDPYTIVHDDKLQADLRNLARVSEAFADWFSKNGVEAHGVKANIESTNTYLLDSVHGIGLVRTEQMVAADEKQMQDLKRYLLYSDIKGLPRMFEDSEYGLRDILKKLNENAPVKIRLFDFVHSEILNAEEQKTFVEKYGKMDIHGGEALNTWPHLYEKQIQSIFHALKSADIFSGQPLEIMMPALKDEAEVLKVKEMVDAAAKKNGVHPGQYSFGTMVETLASCENIRAIAKHCDFISFGTNDLTQEYFNMARSDLKAHAGFEKKNGYDPFKTLAPKILDIVTETVHNGREQNPKLRVDLCGAQAADPKSAVALFNAGIDNVSVAPSLGNLYGLPIMTNYALYDAAREAPAAVPQVTPQKQAI
ncbi:MAG: hypothetical protein PW788_12435 [Micavibrio sp.]|nr:hypothetical protein [Micavibrio sp.]